MGWLADEKGLKDIFDIKGQAGQCPCFNCNNVRRFMTRTVGGRFVTLACTDPSRFELRTNAQLRAMLMRLSEAPTKTDREALENAFGINFAPDGLLRNTYLMTHVLDPVNNYLRDPMHTLSSHGVAGTHIALLVQTLKHYGVKLDIAQAYAKKFPLPRARGTVSDSYFQDSMLESDHVQHFASDVLGMIPILHTFLQDKFEPMGLIPPITSSVSRCCSIYCAF